MKTVIFDLDGTLAIIKKRLAIANENGHMDWDEFFNPDNIQLDEPNWPVIETLQNLYEDFFIRIFSGRDERSRKETEEWLEKYNVPYVSLWMRPEGDFTPDDVLKKDWLHKLIDLDFVDSREDILCVYDDRNKVVDMWRSEGIPCFQVAPGDF